MIWKWILVSLRAPELSWECSARAWEQRCDSRVGPSIKVRSILNMMGGLGRRVFLESPVAAIRFQSASLYCVSGILSQRSNYMGKLPPFFILGVLAFKSDGAVSPESHVPAPWSSRQAGTVFPKLFRKSRFAWGNSRHFLF